MDSGDRDNGHARVIGPDGLVTGSAAAQRLTPSEREVITVLLDSGRRMTEPEIAAELVRRGVVYASVSTRRALARLMNLGWCHSSKVKPRGYLLLAPSRTPTQSVPPPQETPVNLDPNAPISMAQAAKMIRGRGNRSVNVETLRRWANPRRGCYPAGPDGPQLLLKTVRISNELITRPVWVEAFEAERLRLGQREQLPPPPREPSSRRRAAENRLADEILDRMGIGKKDGEK